MNTKNKLIITAAFLFCGILTFNLLAQDSTKSLAFKKNRPYRNSPYFYQPDLSYQLLQQFKLVQLANSGDPLAQHELGLRLLTGEGISADTIKAVFWIKKAASQKLTSALYNYGIMLINGWGTDWNPFDAFDNFSIAAESGMSQAQYVLGVLYTDNLIVPRDWNKAYYWIKKADSGGFEPAKNVLKEISPKVTIAFKDSVEQNKISLVNNSSAKKENDESKIKPSLNLVFIDFNTDLDTIKEVSDKVLISDLMRTEIDTVLNSFSDKNDSSLSTFYDKSKIVILRDLADSGSPEALTILGKLYQQGDYLGMNKLNSAEFYIRATILDSPRAAFLLWNLVREKDFYNILNDAIQFDDPVAQFVWYGLKKLGYDNRLSDNDAINLLQKSAEQKHIPAIIELGFNYYTGKFVKVDEEKGLEYWQLAKQLGSLEADVRIETSRIFDSIDKTNLKNSFDRIVFAEKRGSLLAQFTLGHCYEYGLGVKTFLPNAVKYYRNASQRGSQFAFAQLKRLYDDKRPASDKFRVENQ